MLCAGLVHGSVVINFTSGEDFDQAVLDGQNGWSVSIPGDASVVAGGLSYTAGSVVHNGGDQKLSIFGGDEARASIALPAAYSPGETFYFSFLFNHNSGDNFTWFAFSGGAADDNFSVSAVGQNAGGQPRLRSRVRDTAQTQVNGNENHDMGNNITRLVVGEVFFGGDSANSTITLWMDPTSLDKNDAINPIVNNGRNIGITELNTLWIRKGGNEGEGFIDHIMVGDSWDAVVIPEPSTYAALFGAAAFGIVLLLRRRRG
ncbi:MAG: PEP-CTERM sorting domain-containing protein [Opitutales bacterium]|nr:PEP-CTERM sorting domain-containing protein [Opitutales bacterium]